MVELPNVATRFSYTPQRYMTTVKRSRTLIGISNVREGISARDDVPPERFFIERLPEGFARGQSIDGDMLEKAKAEYYHLRGWDSDGTPTKRNIRSLGLQEP